MCEDRIRLYVFGSWLKSSCPNDVDLLWIFSKRYIETAKAVIQIEAAERLMASEFGLPIHHTILSEEEEREVNFLTDVSAEYVGEILEEPSKLVKIVFQMKACLVKENRGFS